jgi:hypothetical protein
MDKSSGDTCLGIPAAGTPAIADESMSDWMEYLHKQNQALRGNEVRVREGEKYAENISHNRSRALVRAKLFQLPHGIQVEIAEVRA